MRPTTLALSALALAAAATPAFAQYNDFAQRCRTMNGPAQVDSCINALRYEPANAEMLSRLGDGLLASNRPGGAFDAYNDALIQRPGMPQAAQGRDEALRQINARVGAPVPVAQTVVDEVGYDDLGPLPEPEPAPEPEAQSEAEAEPEPEATPEPELEATDVPQDGPDADHDTMQGPDAEEDA